MLRTLKISKVRMARRRVKVQCIEKECACTMCGNVMAQKHVSRDAFAQLGGPVPQAWSAHRWRYADTEPPLQLGCLWDADTGIGLCGDWLNGGKVEGAWLSGRALGRRVIDS